MDKKEGSKVANIQLMKTQKENEQVNTLTSATRVVPESKKFDAIDSEIEESIDEKKYESDFE